MFGKNVGSVEKIIRIVVGALLIIGGLMGQGIWMWLGLIIGAILVITGLLGTCPIWSVLGINTNGNK